MDKSETNAEKSTKLATRNDTKAPWKSVPVGEKGWGRRWLIIGVFNLFFLLVLTGIFFAVQSLKRPSVEWIEVGENLRSLVFQASLSKGGADLIKTYGEFAKKLVALAEQTETPLGKRREILASLTRLICLGIQPILKKGPVDRDTQDILKDCSVRVEGLRGAPGTFLVLDLCKSAVRSMSEVLEGKISTEDPSIPPSPGKSDVEAFTECLLTMSHPDSWENRWVELDKISKEWAAADKGAHEPLNHVVREMVAELKELVRIRMEKEKAIQEKGLRFAAKFREDQGKKEAVACPVLHGQPPSAARPAALSERVSAPVSKKVPSVHGLAIPEKEKDGRQGDSLDAFRPEVREETVSVSPPPKDSVPPVLNMFDSPHAPEPVFLADHGSPAPYSEKSKPHAEAVARPRSQGAREVKPLDKLDRPGPSQVKPSEGVKRPEHSSANPVSKTEGTVQTFNPVLWGLPERPLRVGQVETLGKTGLTLLSQKFEASSVCEKPDKLDRPSRPELPTLPEPTEKPDIPSKPEMPSIPEKPDKPEKPAKPETPSLPEKPAKPEVTVKPEVGIPELIEKPQKPDLTPKPDKPEKIGKDAK